VGGTPLDVVTGAAGYTGRYITARLLAAGRSVRTLTGHPGRPTPFGDAVEVRPLPFDDLGALAASLRGVDTLYNTYWVRFARGGVDHAVAVSRSRALIRAAESAGVRRFVHVSITGADSSLSLPYFRGKGLVEEALRASGLSWGIARPALIFGPEDVLVHNIAWLLRRSPVFAVFGDGRYRVRPVHVDDLARLCVDLGGASENTLANAVGPERFTYADMVGQVAAAVGRRPPILHLPPMLAWTLTLPVGWMVGYVVVTRAEIRGLMAGLLDVDGPSTGERLFSAWLQEQPADLGRTWASEMRRHFALR
jgi:NADH dehydrogenase